MTVTLTPELEQIVNEQLASGQFASADEVVAVSLQFLRRQYEELKAMIAEGLKDIEAGRVAPFDPRATLEQVRARRAAKTENAACEG